MQSVVRPGWDEAVIVRTELWQSPVAAGGGAPGAGDGSGEGDGADGLGGRGKETAEGLGELFPALAKHRRPMKAFPGALIPAAKAAVESGLPAGMRPDILVAEDLGVRAVSIGVR